MSAETATKTATSRSALEPVFSGLVMMVRGVAFAVISFLIFFICPVGLYATVSTTDTVPLWFIIGQLIIFLFMAQHGLPILYAQIKHSLQENLRNN